MKIFYINLHKDTVRRESMEKQLTSLNLRYSRIPAIYGRELSKQTLTECYSVKKAYRNQSRELTPAEIGCAMSHIHIYQKIVAEKIPYALILEDDVVLPSSFTDAMHSFNDFIRMDRPEVLLLSPAEPDWKQKGQVRTSGKYQAVPFAKGFFTSSYIVTHLAAQSLLCELYPISMVADSWQRLSTFRVVDLFVISPCLIEQDQETFGSSTTAGYKTFSSLWQIFIYKLLRSRCIILDLLSITWRRTFHPYNDVLK